MAADSADTSLLTSAIEEDPTESPNANHTEQSEICHHHHHQPRKDVPKKHWGDQNGALLRDFDEVIDYIDYSSLIWSWLSRICSKSDIHIFSFKQSSYLCPQWLLIDIENISNDNNNGKRKKKCYAKRF